MTKHTDHGRLWMPLLLATAALLLAGMFYSGGARPQPVYGQLPDSGAQRNEMIRELRKVNMHLAEMTGLLREIRDEARAARKDRTRPQPAAPRP